MSQSQVTDYFHGRKRNGNFQPSKRQKVEVESYNSDTPSSASLQVARASSAKKTNLGGVQTKSTTVTPNNKKRSTRSGIPKLQTDNIVRLSDIWSKTYEATINADLLITDADQVSTKLLQNSVIRHSPSKQNLLDNGKQDDVSVAGVDTANKVTSSKLSKSPSKRTLQYEEAEGGTVSDVATAVIDDHGNSHPCTPSKLRTVEPTVLSTNKRGRCVVPTDSSNYYKTPQKFDFSPFQTKTLTQRSSSARKKLTLSNDSITKSPPVFVFKGTPEKPSESSVAVDINEKDLAEIQNKANDVSVKLPDKVEDSKSSSTSVTEIEPTVEPAMEKTQKKQSKTPSKNATDVVKIGTCRNLEQLKKKLQELSPRKARASVTDDSGSSAVKRYRPV